MGTSKETRSLHTASLLANVQQDLEVLFTSTSEAILLIEANGTILAANDIGAGWLHHNAQSLMGENLFQLHSHPDTSIEALVQETVSKKTILESDFHFGDRFIIVRLIPIIEGKQVTRLIIIGQDVTEHKRAGEQVREFTEQMDRKVRDRTKELEALNRKLLEDKRHSEIRVSLSQHLMQDTRDYSYLLEHITTEIADLVGDTCLVALFTSELTQMEVKAIADRNVETLLRQREQLLNRVISVETNPIVSKTLTGGRFSRSGISKKEGTKILPPEFAALLGKDGLSVLEVFPLQAGDQPLGLLAISRDYGTPYSDEEMSFVSSLISPIALAIHNARLFGQLTESQNKLRGLSQQLVQLQEDQFSRLADELHDRVGQDMTAININLNILRTLLPRDVSKEVISRLADTEKLVTESVKRMRSTMTELHPPMIDKYGLTATLYWYCEQYQRRTKTRVIINDRYMKNTRLPADVEIALFRIAQEALNNVAKHARATKIDIELFEEEGNVMMAVTDDGIGFDTKAQGSGNPQHWGVTLMQERMQAINGEFLLRSILGQGTQIIVRVKREL